MPRSAERGILPAPAGASASECEASGGAEQRASERLYLIFAVLESGARPPITGGQTRERWSDAMASARRRASLERVVCSLF